MTIHITFKTSDITNNDIIYEINKCNITYLFLSIVISKTMCKAVKSKVFIRIVVVSLKGLRM